MRENMGLYRGKRRDTGEWVEGYLAGYDLICTGEPQDVSHATGKYYGETPYVGFVEVDPSTVGRFTGLMGNGKRIFEGDIVTYCWYEVGPMNFCVDFVSGEFLAVPIKKLDGVWAIRISGTNKKMEVIGNIHDGEFGGGRE